jgi:hypothetical protein
MKNKPYFVTEQAEPSFMHALKQHIFNCWSPITVVPCSSVVMSLKQIFPRQIKKFPSNPQFFPLIKLFQNNLHAVATLRNCLPSCTHAQHTCQNQPCTSLV